MLGNYKKISYGASEVNSFIPYSLNELYITSKSSNEVNKLVNEIENLFPLPTPSNRFLYDLIQDVEMIESFNLDGSEYTLADLHAPSDYDLFSAELKELKEIFAYVPEHLNTLGYSNRFLKDFHHALFNKYNTYYPGEFRRTISFTGGKTIEQAKFVSAPVANMQHNMDEMELFMHREDVSVFLRSGYLYYQIMTNLPFLIGNEMIARTVAQLYLREFGIIDHYIPLSKHLKRIERKRTEAIEKRDINIFLCSYLKALKAAIVEVKSIVVGYNKLKVNQKRKIDKSDHTIYQKRRLNEVLHQSFKTVYVLSAPLEERFDVKRKTIKKRYRFLEELGIIKSRDTYFSTLYYNEAMLKLVNG